MKIEKAIYTILCIICACMVSFTVRAEELTLEDVYQGALNDEQWATPPLVFTWRGAAMAFSLGITGDAEAADAFCPRTQAMSQYQVIGWLQDAQRALGEGVSFGEMNFSGAVVMFAAMECSREASGEQP